MANQPMLSCARRGDGHLWGIALGLSLLVNTALLGSLGLAAVVLAKRNPQPPPAAPSRAIAVIYPELAPVRVVTPEPASNPGKSFARTSEDQSAPRPDQPAFLGERDTRATSDAAPDPAAQPLPSQSGVTPNDPSYIETTQSDYQDGRLDPAPPAPPEPTPATSDPSDPSDPSDLSDLSDLSDPARTPAVAAAQREALLAGPNPMDVPVPRDSAAAQAAEASPSVVARPPPPVVPDQKFSGFQRKTALTGSISRSGRSALDVEDSPLGRYQAALSRAVEQEWQRNCVRHRDFITPGFLTVRFFVEPAGKVRSVQFVGDMETGEVQKGFTLNSIRNAPIPAMPAALRRQYDQEPLELVFRFYF